MIAAIFSGFLLKKLPLPVVSVLGTVLTSVGVLLAGALYTPPVIKYSLGIITGTHENHHDFDSPGRLFAGALEQVTKSFTGIVLSMLSILDQNSSFSSYWSIVDLPHEYGGCKYVLQE